jgi:hypothetical protein
MIRGSNGFDRWSRGQLVQFIDGPFVGLVGEVIGVDGRHLLIRISDGIYIRLPIAQTGRTIRPLE